MADAPPSPAADAASVLGALWPVIFLVVFMCLLINCGPQLRDLMARAEKAQFETGPDGVKIYLEDVDKSEAKSVLVRMLKQKKGLPTAKEIEQVDYLLAGVKKQRTGRVLWVDSNPHTSQWEAKALVLLGLKVRRERTEREALEVLKLRDCHEFDAIVVASYDKGQRVNEGDLDILREFEDRCKRIIFYTGSTTEDVEKSKSWFQTLVDGLLCMTNTQGTRGGSAEVEMTEEEENQLYENFYRHTHSPTELLEIVVNAVVDSKEERKKCAACRERVAKVMADAKPSPGQPNPVQQMWSAFLLDRDLPV